MNKVIIAIDSFKGCLTSKEAEEAAKEGIQAVFPNCQIVQIPISDGGEGLLGILQPAIKGEYKTISAHDPLMRPINGKYILSKDKRTAIIEMAVVNGLTLLPKEKRNPMLTTTYGTGELILDALKQGCRNLFIGIGGSATNDAGIGMLQALGFRFLDKEGNLLGTGGQILSQIVSIDTSQAHSTLKEAHFIIACDVQNPFCGPTGAAYAFAPQKGADPEMVKVLDTGMYSFAKVIQRTTGKEIINHPGAGAAGGLGGGFLAFLNTELKPGIQLILETLNFQELIAGADLIITGEGQMDSQTIMGKVPFGVLKEAQKQKIPVIAITGSFKDIKELTQVGFHSVFSISPGPNSLEESMKPDFTKENIRRLVNQICAIIHSFQAKSI